MKRYSLSLCVLIFVTAALAAPQSKARRAGARAKSRVVIVTLVRWPYT